jgi:hypothetical protein
VQIFRRSTGELLDVWDLHVGARVDVLGRTVTLRQASLDTITWLDHQARRLIRRKQQLEHSLNKFCHTPYTAVQHHSHVRVPWEAALRRGASGSGRRRGSSPAGEEGAAACVCVRVRVPLRRAAGV